MKIANFHFFFVARLSRPSGFWSLFLFALFVHDIFFLEKNTHTPMSDSSSDSDESSSSPRTFRPTETRRALEYLTRRLVRKECFFQCADSRCRHEYWQDASPDQACPRCAAVCPPDAEHASGTTVATAYVCGVCAHRWGAAFDLRKECHGPACRRHNTPVSTLTGVLAVGFAACTRCKRTTYGNACALGDELVCRTCAEPTSTLVVTAIASTKKTGVAIGYLKHTQSPHVPSLLQHAVYVCACTAPRRKAPRASPVASSSPTNNRFAALLTASSD